MASRSGQLLSENIIGKFEAVEKSSSMSDWKTSSGLNYNALNLQIKYVRLKEQFACEDAGAKNIKQGICWALSQIIIIKQPTTKFINGDFKNYVSLSNHYF